MALPVTNLTLQLSAPFNGIVFYQMFSEAVDTVLGHFLQAFPSGVSNADRDLYKSSIKGIMLNTLNDVAFNGMKQYDFSVGADNSLLLNKLAYETGAGLTFIETIVSLAFTDSATGDIPNWFGNPAQAVQAVKTSANIEDALRPSFIQRVAATIFAPFGISGSQAILILEIGLAVIVLFAIAYFWRSFK